MSIKRTYTKDGTRILLTGLFKGYTLTLEVKPQDLWVGAFWKRNVVYHSDTRRAVKVDVWVCLLPCLPIHMDVYSVFQNAATSQQVAEFAAGYKAQAITARGKR